MLRVCFIELLNFPAMLQLNVTGRFVYYYLVEENLDENLKWLVAKFVLSLKRI